jgi:hypothetical protein
VLTPEASDTLSFDESNKTAGDLTEVENGGFDPPTSRYVLNISRNGN